MRPLLPSLSLWGVALAAFAGGAGAPASLPQIPFGQVYKDFQFPFYQNGQLSYTLSAVSAKGVTINRAETTDLKIQIYTDGKVTTTITSPKADLYVAERKMRTKNTVKVDRADLTATAQNCDFDLITKIFLMREKVRVVLKNFDAGVMPKKPAAPTTAASAGTSILPAPVPVPGDMTTSDPRAKSQGDGNLDVPGAYGNTNSAPLPPVPTTQ
jgi:hypothetical protein